MSSERRNILIHNSHSTRAAKVKGLLSRLDSAEVSYETHMTPSPHAEDNIDWMANLVQSGDRIFSAAGDGTASQMGEGILHSGADDIEVGLGPYGGFNDGPASLGHVDVADFFNGRVGTRELVPIDMEMDGEARKALFYITLGWTAGFAEQFMTENREAMQKSHIKIVQQMSRAALYYAQHGRDKLPEFTVGDQDTTRFDASDVLVRSSPVMAKMIRGRDFMSESQFGFRELNVGNLAKNIPYLYDSVVRGQTPDTPVERTTLKFTDPATFYLMRDGESELVHDVKSLIFSKRTDGVRLNVATTKS